METYVQSWNEVLNRYASSPYRTAPNELIAADYWKNKDASLAAYDRGAILAAKWNHDWRALGGSLDEVMTTLRLASTSVANFHTLSFIERLTYLFQAADTDITTSLRNHITNGVPICLPRSAFGGCLDIVLEDIPVFDPGYDPESSAAAGRFVGVKQESNAYAGGLRDGMQRLARLSGDECDSRVPYSFLIRDDNETERVITYLPQGAGVYKRQRVIIPTGTPGASLERCRIEVANY